MEPAFGALLIAAGIAAVADWVAVGAGAKRLEYLAKPAVPLFLIGWVVAAAPGPTAPWFAVALAFSLAGDVFLMLPRNLFVLGLASFLLAHLAFIVALAPEIEGPVFAGAFVAAVVFTLPVLVRLIRAVRMKAPALQPPIYAYAVAICGMAAAAVGTREVSAAAGGILFVVSDMLLAWNRFVRQVAWAPLAVIVTYHTALFGLVLSTLQ